MYNQKIRIIVADDHRLFREGIIELLKESAMVEIIGQVESGKELIAEYFKKKPDLLLVDIAMPGLSGYEAFEQIRERDKSAKALFLSMHTEEIYYYQIYKSGGKGLVSKNVFSGELETAITWIMKGRCYFGPDYDEEKLDELVKKYELLDDHNYMDQIYFTERESEIMKMIVQGSTSNEIADYLQVSKRTIDKHRESIMKKANVKNLMELYQFAQKYF